MGSIRNTKQSGEHKLKDAEFSFYMNIHQSQQIIYEEYNRMKAALLNYIAKSEWGYDPAQDLQFEFDIRDKDHTVKVTKL